jgi:hypothetical protein
MKPSIFLFLLLVLSTIAGLILFAPYIGLGSYEDFILWRLYGIRRSVIFPYPVNFAFLLCVYQALSIGCQPGGGVPAPLLVAQRAWEDGAAILGGLLSPSPQSSDTSRAWLKISAIAVACIGFFTVFIAKSTVLFHLHVDQHAHQAMVDYDYDWKTPLFSFAGNLIYQFGIQFPLNTQVMPALGLAELGPWKDRITVAVVLMFLAAGFLFWAVGRLLGLRPVPRAFFAGAVALIISVPRGIEAFVWIFPPEFFTTQFTLALWWQEAPLIMVATIVAFYWIGQARTLPLNIAAVVIAVIGCFEPILGYPAGAVYFIPLVAVCCFGLLLTVTTRREFVWKVAFGAGLLAVMIGLCVPDFFRGLYQYSVGSYLFDAVRMDSSELFKTNFMATQHDLDPRGLFVYLVSFAGVLIGFLKGSGGLRRLAGAVLICEAAIIVIGTLIALVMRAPIGLGYAELALSSLWVSYFVLALLVLSILIDRRIVAALNDWLNRSPNAIGRYVLNHRSFVYTAIPLIGIAAYAGGVPNAEHFSTYPPARPPAIQLIEREVKLEPGQMYRGTVFTLVRKDIPVMDQPDVEDVVANHYRRLLSNDFMIDLPALDIPALYEHEHWNSPIRLAFLRTFFARRRDAFAKAFYILSAYNPKIARLSGVRVVVTNDQKFSDGTLIHEENVGGEALRIFRLGDVNVGQYSPTNGVRSSTAAQILDAMKAASFDPKHDVVVEDALPAGLVPATSAAVTTDYGPTLSVRASSNGQSLVVLPFEFSRCLNLQVNSGESVRLIPANLFQIGLLFSGNADVKISYRFGLLGDVRCRAEDIARADALRVRDLEIWQR